MPHDMTDIKTIQEHIGRVCRSTLSISKPSRPREDQLAGLRPVDPPCDDTAAPLLHGRTG